LHFLIKTREHILAGLPESESWEMRKAGKTNSKNTGNKNQIACNSALNKQKEKANGKWNGKIAEEGGKWVFFLRWVVGGGA